MGGQGRAFSGQESVLVARDKGRDVPGGVKGKASIYPLLALETILKTLTFEKPGKRHQESSFPNCRIGTH